MAARHCLWLIPLVVGLAMCRLCGNSDFVDGTFSNSSWTASKIVDTTAGSAATVSAFQNLSGGNPAAYREVDETCKTAGAMFVAHFLGGAIYAPGDQGPIASIAFSCDFIEFNPPSTGAQVGFGILLQQGGTNFIVFNTSGSTNWMPTNQPFLTAASFFNIDTATGKKGLAHPDFSTNGSDIAFGYITATSSSAGAITNQCGLDNYSVAIVSVQPPVIVKQPQDQAVFVGTSANLVLTVTGSTPLSYQWYFNDTNLISGATTSTLHLTSVATSQSGLYHAVVSNAAGSVVSSKAQLTVVTPETNQPPVLPVISPQTVNELTLLTVTNTATVTSSNATVSYALVGTPAAMAIDANGIIRWTPAQTQSPGTNRITTVATSTDSLDPVNPTLSVTNQFTVIVQEVNVAPALREIPPQLVQVPNQLTVTNTAPNQNIHATLTYLLVGAPAGMAIDATGIIRWTPSPAQSPSTNTVSTIATSTDAKDLVNPVLSTTNAFTVIVQEVNVPPGLRTIAPQTVSELSLLTVTNTATNSNIHAVLGYTLISAPAGMTIDGNGIIRWTPAHSQSPGTNLVATVATSTDTLDPVNPVLTATNSFLVIVREINRSPALPVIPTQTVNELTLLTVTNTATAGNARAVLSYRLVGPPVGMSIDANGILRWTPAQTQSPGTNLITSVVTSADSLDPVNPSLNATNQFVVIVQEVNVAPVVRVVPSQVVRELNLLTVTNTATVSNIHSTLSYTLVGAPAGMTIDGGGLIRWTPSQTQSPSTNTITTIVTSTDAKDLVNPTLNATNAFTVVVQEANVAPVPRVISPQTVNELTLLTVTNTATEANLHAVLSYTLVGAPEGMTIDGSGIIRWTPAQTQSPTTNLITTIATSTDIFDLVDPILTATNSFTVIVREINQAPVPPVIPLQTASELSLLTVTNTATVANIHAVIGYSLTSPPAGVTIDSVGIIRWTPAHAQSPGTYAITTVATSTDSLDLVNPTLSTTNTFSVIVQPKESNATPLLGVILPQTVNELTLLTVVNTGIESDSKAVLGYRLLNPPPGMTIDGNGVIRWTPAQTQSPSTNLITTVVTSTDSLDLVNPTLSATNQFTVIVREVNVAPVLPVIPQQVVSALSLLAVSNTATEANLHSVLSYALVGPPAGMTIDGSGIIRWTPSQAQSPGTNVITTVATSTLSLDPVNPTLSTTNVFLVVVKAASVAPLITITSPGELSVEGTVGLTFPLQASRDLVQWTTVTNVTIAATPFRWTDPKPDPDLRFYRALITE